MTLFEKRGVGEETARNHSKCDSVYLFLFHFYGYGRPTTRTFHPVSPQFIPPLCNAKKHCMPKDPIRFIFSRGYMQLRSQGVACCAAQNLVHLEKYLPRNPVDEDWVKMLHLYLQALPSACVCCHL